MPISPIQKPDLPYSSSPIQKPDPPYDPCAKLSKLIAEIQERIDAMPDYGPQIEEIKEALAAQGKVNDLFDEDLQNISRQPGPQGEQGLTGPQGEIGPAGPPGDNATFVISDLTDEQIAELVQRLPPFYPRWIRSDGSVIDEIPGGVHLGELLNLRLDRRVSNARPN